MNVKSLGSGAIVLALGFASGWWGRSLFVDRVGTRSIDPAAAQSPSDSPASERKTGGTLATPEHPTITGAQHGATSERLHTLTWGKQKGLQIGVNVFMNDGLDPTFASVFDLTPGEVNALNGAIRSAKEKLFAIAVQDAKVEPSADGSRFVVEVPSTTDQGGAVYDSLLKTFSDVLGPDRFQSFNDLSGLSFESGFGSFGLANTRYEMSASETASSSGAPLYKILVSSTLPGAQTTSTSLLPLEDVGTYYPLLGHFIPPGFQPHPGPK
jgi:hypothetical protein